MTYSEMMNTMTDSEKLVVADSKSRSVMARKIVQSIKAGYPRKHVVVMINEATK